MKTTNLLTLAITLTVGIILAGSLLVPVINDYSDNSTKVFVNEDTYRMSPVGDQTIVFHYADGEYTVNDVAFTKANRPITQNDTLMFYALNDTRAGFEYVITSEGYNRYAVTAATDLTITYNGAEKTVTSVSIVSGTTYSSSYTYTNEVYYADPEGEYVWFGAKEGTMYIGGEWPEFNCWSNNDVGFYSVMGDVVTYNGTIQEGVTITKERTPDSMYSNVYTLDTYSITHDDTTTECRGYLIPREVVGTNTMYSDTSALMSAIPVLVIVGLVVTALGAIYIKRDD